jgi:signal transduction histidine kinase
MCLRSRFQLAIYWGPQLVLLYNDAERDVLGAMHPHVLGRPAAEVLADVWHVVGPMLQGVLATGEATWSVDEALRLNRNGFMEEAFFTFSYSPILEGDGVGGVLLVTVETTDRVLAERQLRTLRELAAETTRARNADEVCVRAAGVLAGNPSDLPFSLLFLTEPDGSPRACASTGAACIPDPSFWPLREVALTHNAQLVEVVARLPGSETLPQAALVLPIAQADKEAPAGFLVAGLSDFRQLDEAYRGFLDLVAGQIASAIAGAQVLEEERRRAEALAAFDAAKTAFFANVSHEFRTPLTLLLAPLEDTLAQTNSALSPVDRERLTVAHRNGLRLLKLVNMLLEFSRIEAGRVQAVCEPTDLAAFTTELASMFRSAAQRAGMRLVVDCPPLPRPALVDRDMWEKIVLNLLSNAFKFTQEGEITVALRAVGAEAELSVRDTGVGIPEEELPRLFERFYQIKGTQGRALEGTGIGLALVHELVKLHGGSMRVDSTPGRGSTFVVSVPLGSAPVAPEPVRVASPPPPREGADLAEATRWLPSEEVVSSQLSVVSEEGIAPAPLTTGNWQLTTSSRARVLVADDNRDMRQYLGRLLAGAYEVELAADGIAALAAIRERQPDLVLADVMMPELDGFGLLAQLRGDPHTRIIPVVLLSARAGEESRLEGLAAGADDYLVKPFSARELLARVGAHLEMARVRRDAALRESELRAEARQAQERALRKARDELELRVQERTRELSEANARLGRQIARRKRAEEARTELLRRIVHAQEEEHRRIARELHDDLTQRLAVLAIDAGVFAQLPSCPRNIALWAHGMRDQLVALSTSVHSLSRQLHPSILDDLGLVDALRSECLSLAQRDGIKVNYCTQDVPTNLHPGVALCLYRVAQEALRNVARHAMCPRASVRLVANEGELVLSVRDRGVGFEVAAQGKAGIGLESMRERARLIRARLTVRSQLGKGTRITVRVPLQRSCYEEAARVAGR